MKRVTLILIFLALVVASYAQEKGGSAETEVSGSYSQAFGRSVTVSDDYVTAFYDDSYPGKVGINEPNPHSTLHYDGSEASAYATKTSSYSLTDSDHTIFTHGSGITITLPAVAYCGGRIYFIKNTDGDYSITINVTGGGGSIEGVSSITLNASEGIIVQSNGSDNWYIIAKYD